MTSLIFLKDCPGVGVGFILTQTLVLPIAAYAEIKPVLVVGIGTEDFIPIYDRSHFKSIPLIPVHLESKPTLTVIPTNSNYSDIIKKIDYFFEPPCIPLLNHHSFMIKETDSIQVYLLQKKVPKKYPIFYLETPFLYISRDKPLACHGLFAKRTSIWPKTAPYFLQNANFCIAIALEARGPPLQGSVV